MAPHLDVWNISWQEFPYEKDLRNQVLFLLQYAILAPSTHNIQPWLFRLTDEGCDFMCDSRAQLSHGDREGRYRAISIGAAVENFIIAANVFQMSPVVVSSSEEVYARVLLKKSTGVDEHGVDLLDALCNRVNVRKVFEPRSLPDDLISHIKNKSVGGQCTVHVLSDQRHITRVAELTSKGLRAAHKNTLFRQEIARHIVSNVSKKSIGIPGYTLNLPLLPSLIIPTLMRYFDLSPVLSKLNHRTVASAPLMCVLTTKHSRRSTWTLAGRIAEHIMIEGERCGISSSIYVAATEFPDTVEKLREILQTDEQPVFLFCMGYVKDRCKHSQRVSVEDKLV